MHKPDHVIEIFLQPGDFYFGGKDTRIRTVLGSCVSIVLWHPKKKIGGMCHYMLPSRVRRKGEPLDGRYANEAMELLLREIGQSGTHPHDYHAKVFGGGNMFPGTTRNAATHVGKKNVEMARKLIKEHGFSCVSEHLEGDGHRNVIFDVWSGHVWVKHQPISGGEGSGRKLLLCPA